MSEPTITVGENCYVSLEDANDIAATRLFAAQWNAAADTTRVQALLTATALLNRMSWQGQPWATNQALAWPRVPDRCSPIELGWSYYYDLQYVPDDLTGPAVPAAIITATVELAIHLLRTGDHAGQPVMQRMVGDSMVMYFPTIADELPKHVRRLIEPHLRSSSANVAEVRF